MGKYRSKPNPKSRSGFTPLILAAIHKRFIDMFIDTFLLIAYFMFLIFMKNFFINNPIFTLREDVCKVLVEVYGADIDIRDFSGKKAFHYLKSHYPEKNFEWVSWNSYDFIVSSNTFLTYKIFSYSDLFLLS